MKLWIFLVVGVALELYIIVREHNEAHEDFVRGTIHTPVRPSLKSFATSLLGCGLVTIGVAGEFGAHLMAGTIQSELQEKSRQLTGLLNEKAERATAEASAATSTAKGFEAQIAEAKARAAEARSMAEREVTARETIEVELLRLRERLADRHLQNRNA